MKKYKSEELIDLLEKDVHQLIAAAKHLQGMDAVKLSYPPQQGKWSVAQALEHLNMYNRYYLPVIKKAMEDVTKESNAWFVPGFLGNYFTKTMLPKNVYEIKNKMKAQKNYCPSRGVHVETVFQEFLQHQNTLLHLLEMAKKRNLETIRIPITLTKLIKLKLGDAFRFLIAHEQRHIMQARNTIKTIGISTDKFPVILEAARL